MISSSWQVQEPELVEVGYFGDPWRLQLARGLLESAGVDCWVPVAGVHRGQPSHRGLMVRAQDAADAQQLLLEAEREA